MGDIASVFRIFPAVATSGVLRWLVIWLLTPALLVLIAAFGVWFAVQAERQRDKVSRLAGLLLALAVFIGVIWAHQDTQAFAFTEFNASVRNVLLACGAGIVVGFIFIHLISALVNLRLGSILVVVLVAGSLSALYFHFTESSVRVPVFLFTLGLVIGTLLHVMFLPVDMERLGVVAPERRRR